MKSNIIPHNKVCDFILSGKALFTFLNTKTQNRFTFKVKKHKVDEIFFVQVLTSPDVYQFIGTIRNGVFFHSKKSNISKEAQSVKVFEWVFMSLTKNSLPDFIEVWHEGKCGKCGRTLTVPQSIESGFGPECSRRR